MIRQSIQCLLSLTVLTGLVYPLLVTAIAQGLFPNSANGSLLMNDGHITGSRLLGQPFENPKYFWSRPSATGPFAYNTASSSGSNFGPLNPDFRKALETRIAALKAANPQGGDIPIDLIMASASGLDPHISPAAAEYQLARVSNVRGISVAHARELIARYTDAPQLGFLGNAGVNVLLLNQALDRKE